MIKDFEDEEDSEPVPAPIDNFVPAMNKCKLKIRYNTDLNLKQKGKPLRWKK